MDDEEKQIVELRTAVLNLYNTAAEQDENAKQFVAEVRQLNNRLEKIEKFLGNQNGKSEKQ